MRERSSLMNLFWTVMAILVVCATIFGGYVAWRLVRSATPKIERATVDPEQLLERTVSARQEEIPAEITDAETGQASDVKADTQIDEKTSTKQEAKKEGTVFSRKNEEPFFWEDDEEYYDEELEEDTKEEENAAGTSLARNKEFSYTLEDVSTPEKSSRPAEKTKVSTVKNAAPKIIYASYQEGLLQCKRSQVFPCSWKDTNGPLIKQYWLRSPQGPIERIIFARTGRIISQTFSGLNGVVTRYQGNFAELYFEGGLLTKIRTFPYDNPNLRDWFLIDKKGKISACLCGIPTDNCCARSFLYREGGSRRYCDLFPLDADFCPK